MADLKKAIETVQDMLDVMDSHGSCYAYKHNGGDARLRNVMDCLKVQQERETNDPLTLEELRQMDGEPVWICPAKLGGEISERWMLMSDFFEEKDLYLFRPASGISQRYNGANYGKTWLAYRRKPEKQA